MADGSQVAKPVETETVQSDDANQHGFGAILDGEPGSEHEGDTVGKKFRGNNGKSDEARWEDSTKMAYDLNLKQLVDDAHHLTNQAFVRSQDLGHQASLRSQDLQEKVNAQFLETAARNAQVANTLAEGYASTSLRERTNAATIDSLAGYMGLAGAAYNSAMLSNVVEQTKSAAKAIIDTAAANAATAATSAQGTTELTSAPAQGITGTVAGTIEAGSAYAGLQAQLNALYNAQQATLNAVLQNAESNSALLQVNKALGDSIVQIATNAIEVNKSLAVLLVEVTGKAVVQPLVTPATTT